MLETLISSKTRVKLLLKFFLNANAKGYLRSLEQEFGESTNAIRLELNKFESAGMLTSQSEGNKKVYSANKNHPLFENLHGLVMKYVGLDQVVESVTEKLGDVRSIYLVGDYAEGRDSGIVDLFLFAPNLNQAYLGDLISKAETSIERRIRYFNCNTKEELQDLLNQRSHLLIWER